MASWGKRMGQERREPVRSNFDEWWDRWFDIPLPRELVPPERLKLLPAPLLRLGLAVAALTAVGTLVLGLEAESAVRPIGVTFGVSGLWFVWSLPKRDDSEDLAGADELALTRSRDSVAQLPDYVLVSPAGAAVWGPLRSAAVRVTAVAIFAALLVAQDGLSVAAATWHAVSYLVLIMAVTSALNR